MKLWGDDNCNDPIPVTDMITQGKGEYGDWLGTFTAPNGYLACGYAIKYHMFCSAQGGDIYGDDHGIKTFKWIFCHIDDWKKKVDHTFSDYAPNLKDSSWSEDKLCPEGMYITALQTKGDCCDSGLTGLNRKCRTLDWSDPPTEFEKI